MRFSIKHSRTTANIKQIKGYTQYVLQTRSGTTEDRILDSFREIISRKWLLYDTKIKDFSFKFYADNKKAEVSLDIEMKDELFRNAYYEKIESLENLLRKDYLPDAIMEEHYFLESGKEISRIWVQKENVSIFNKNSWQETFEFL